MSKSVRTRIVLIVLSLSPLAPASALAESCVKIQVSGTSCESLKLEWDLRACGDEVKKIDPVRCEGNSARASVRGQKARYRIQLRREDGQWGGTGEWKLRGEPQRTVFAASTPVENKKSPAPVFQPLYENKPVMPEQAAPPVPVRKAAFTFGGYFDLYYSYNFNRPAAVAAPTTGALPRAQNGLHYYDWYNRQLGISLAELTVKYARSETTFFMDLDFGQSADISAVLPGSNNAPDELSKHVGQAVLSYTPASQPRLTIEAGKMATHVGLEVIKAKDNWNYTRSTLFSFGIPLWHTGFHAAYALVPERLTANFYLYQGWNTLYENNHAPTWGTQLKFAPGSATTIVYNYIGGPEQANDASNWKQVHDLNVVRAFTGSISLGLDLISGSEENPIVGGTAFGPKAAWRAAEILAKFQLNDVYSISPRLEIYDDVHGYTLGAGTHEIVKTYTLTQALAVSEGLELRLDARLDDSSLGSRFVKQYATSEKQYTTTLGFLYLM